MGPTMGEKSISQRDEPYIVPTSGSAKIQPTPTNQELRLKRKAHAARPCCHRSSLMLDVRIIYPILVSAMLLMMIAVLLFLCIAGVREKRVAILAAGESPGLGRAAPQGGLVLGRVDRHSDAKCRLHLVETIPQNLSFSHAPFTYQPDSPPLSTLDAWKELINGANRSLLIAAYKSSLRGTHVFGDTAQSYSSAGEEVYEALVRAGRYRKIRIQMVENGPSKDRGDNEDGRSLASQGVLSHRELNFRRLGHSGIMHTKFIIADRRHFYLGSANLDWRSLNQKLELGVYARDCPSLAADLASIFDTYWRVADSETEAQILSPPTQKSTSTQPKIFNAGRPLTINSPTAPSGSQHLWVHLGASPPFMNAANREWDLDSILTLIRTARTHVYAQVMDYFPLFLYDCVHQARDSDVGANLTTIAASQLRYCDYWSPIDAALREAALRGVDVRLLTSAIHHPRLGMRFLRSLQAFSSSNSDDDLADGGNNGFGQIEVRLFKVPSSRELPHLVRRDRRAHKKVLVTDSAVLIGTSNWSADYFENKGTGVAIVVREEGSDADLKGEKNAEKRRWKSGVVDEARQLFLRDWHSEYSHPLETYYEACLGGDASPRRKLDGREWSASSMRGNEEICEIEKEISDFRPSLEKYLENTLTTNSVM